MSLQRSFLSILIVIAPVFLGACSSVPVQEMSNARQAIQSAHQVEAHRHAPDLMEQARSQLLDAETAIRLGEWQRARKSAILARSHAVAARVQVVSERIEN